MNGAFIALVALIAVVIGAAFTAGRRRGAKEATTAVRAEQVAAAKRIADAHTNAPADRDALVERLRDGGREL